MTSALPWDRFSPTEPAPSVPAPAPVEPVYRQTGVDAAGMPEIELPWQPSEEEKRIMRGVTPGPPAAPSLELGEALDTLWPDIKELLAGYARDTWEGVKAGQTVDVLHPTITATDISGRELVVADARNRSWRTFPAGAHF